MADRAKEISSLLSMSMGEGVRDWAHDLFRDFVLGRDFFQAGTTMRFPDWTPEQEKAIWGFRPYLEVRRYITDYYEEPMIYDHITVETAVSNQIFSLHDWRAHFIKYLVEQVKFYTRFVNHRDNGIEVMIEEKYRGVIEDYYDSRSSRFTVKDLSLDALSKLL